MFSIPESWKAGPRRPRERDDRLSQRGGSGRTGPRFRGDPRRLGGAGRRGLGERLGVRRRGARRGPLAPSGPSGWRCTWSRWYPRDTPLAPMATPSRPSRGRGMGRGGPSPDLEWFADPGAPPDLAAEFAEQIAALEATTPALAHLPRPTLLLGQGLTPGPARSGPRTRPAPPAARGPWPRTSTASAATAGASTPGLRSVAASAASDPDIILDDPPRMNLGRDAARRDADRDRRKARLRSVPVRPPASADRPERSVRHVGCPTSLEMPGSPGGSLGSDPEGSITDSRYQISEARYSGRKRGELRSATSSGTSGLWSLKSGL